MRINIWDLDYCKNKSINYIAMKVSSFHKQKGDTVNLITKQNKLTLQCDKMYIFKEDDAIKNPPLEYINKAKLYGAGFKYISNWKPNNVIYACRPDYLLYPDLDDDFKRSDALQFTDEKYHLLKMTQNAANTFTNKRTLVLDEHLWGLEKKDLLTVLESLKHKKKIAFLKPISLKRLCDDEDIKRAFISLDFAPGSKLVWYNKYTLTRENINKVLNFFALFKDEQASAIGDISFWGITNKENYWEDFINCMYLIVKAKKMGLHIYIQPLKTRFETIYIHIWDILNDWSENYLNKSFVEYISLYSCKKYNCSIEYFYAHRELWTDERFLAVRDWVKRYIDEFGYEDLLITWKDKTSLSIDINWKELTNTKEI